MSRPGASFAGIVSLVLLCSPLVLSPFMFEQNASFIREVENREPTVFPAINNIGDTLDTKKWDTLSGWLRERVPFRGDVIATKTWVEMELLGERRIGGVDRGDDGWLFLLHSYGGHWRDPGKSVDEALAAMNGFLERNADAPATFRVLLTPDKHTIYPEHLTDDGQRDVLQTIDERNRFESWFAQVDDPRIIDLHAAMRNEKLNTEDELYFRDDTHQNWHGGAIMAESIVDSLQPGTWDDSCVVTTQTITYPGDLRALCGITSMPLRQKEVRATARPGVSPEQITFDGNTYEDFETVDKDPHSWQYPVRSEFESTEGLSLIPGKTLILHDSCIGSIARPLIRPYFEDVTFMHYADASPEFIDQAMQENDTVVLEVVERIAPETFIQLLVEPNPEAPSLLWKRSDAEPVWSMSDARRDQLYPADGVEATLADGRLELESTGISAAVVFNGVDLPANYRYVARVVLRSPGLGQSTLFWSAKDDQMSPERSDSKTIRGGRNELFLEMNSAQPISNIMFEPGGGAGEHVIESLEIRSIPLDTEPATTS
ncbi:MAG: hypothetical protein VX527_03515 [Planctomycetota bacterium]|nr:hypothetical protein [Planctomycetota bacterium]